MKCSNASIALIFSLIASLFSGCNGGNDNGNNSTAAPTANKAAPPTDAAPAPWNVARPFSEYEKTGFVAISTASDDFEMHGLFDAIAANLPDQVSIIFVVPDRFQAVSAGQEFTTQETALFQAGRIQFLQIQDPLPDGAGMIWSRDDLPFPVVMKDGTFGLASSLYFPNFYNDLDTGTPLETAFSLPMTKTQISYRGGNLAVDGAGNCFAEKAMEVAAMKDPTAFFKTYLGCSTVTILDQSGGIGDIDERIKFIGPKDVITDDTGYEAVLTKLGYTVHMIPRISDKPYETYMNTLLVNGTIFVPQMGVSADATAIAAYQALGFKAVPVFTREMADEGDGNIHCVTMNYPPGVFKSNMTLSTQDFAY